MNTHQFYMDVARIPLGRASAEWARKLASEECPNWEYFSISMHEIYRRSDLHRRSLLVGYRVYVTREDVNR